MNPLNISQLRKETPGCEHVLHFNNAGSSLPAKPIIDAIKKHLDLEAIRGGYEAAQLASNAIQAFYEHTAALLNCNREEIAFLDNATRAWDMAFYSIRFKPGDKILTTECEYASKYLSFLHQGRKTGAAIEVIKNDETGQLDVDDLNLKIDERVKLIAITHVPTQGGLVNPAHEVGKIAKQFNIPYLLGATQSVGQMPIDVQALGCDFLCATGRKYLRGPRGTGFLYISKDRIKQCDPPFIDLHAATWTKDNEYRFREDALRFETWEQNIAAKIGLSEAIKYATNLGIPVIWKRIQHLADTLRQQLLETGCIELQDLGVDKCGIVTFLAKNKSPVEIQQYMAGKMINVSVSLQEYARLDMAKRNIPALLRASVHYYNTADEINHFCAEIKKFLRK